METIRLRQKSAAVGLPGCTQFSLHLNPDKTSLHVAEQLVTVADFRAEQTWSFHAQMLVPVFPGLGIAVAAAAVTARPPPAPRMPGLIVLLRLHPVLSLWVLDRPLRHKVCE